MSVSKIVYGDKVQYKLPKDEKPNYILKAKRLKESANDIVSRSPVEVSFNSEGDKKKFLKFLESEFTPKEVEKPKRAKATKK